MNELEIINNNELTIDSREVSEMTGKAHDKLLRDIRGYIKVLDQSPILVTANFFIESTYENNNNQSYPCYLLTKKGCDMVANKMTGEKGILFTATYVTRFEEMETQIKYNVPQISREQQLVLSIYSGGVGAIEATKELTELKVTEATAPLIKKIEGDEPLVIFAGQVSGSEDSIDVGTFSKVIRKDNIQLGRNDLFKWLRKQKYLRGLECEDDTLKPKWFNEPFQKYMDMGIFEAKEYVLKTRFNSELKIKTLITGKGQLYLVKKLKEYPWEDMNLEIAN